MESEYNRLVSTGFISNTTDVTPFLSQEQLVNAVGPLGVPVPIFEPAFINQDELLRVIVARINFFMPSRGFITKSYFVDQLFNPSFVRWEGRVLVTWRSPVQASVLQFGWLHNNSYNEIDSSLTYLGIGKTTVLTPTEVTKVQGDSKMIVLNDGTLLITFATQFERMTRYHFFTIAKNYSVGNSDMGPIVELRYPKYGAHQKSWVMLLFDSELYFFQNINPLRVLKYTGVDKNNSTANLDEIYEGDYVNLPWKKIYGDNLRGGTPAILVNDVYLSFFHSVDR